MKKLTFLLALGVAVLASPDVAQACERCFGVALESDTTRSISIAMLALLGMTGLVWSGIGAFFLQARRRARLLEPSDLSVSAYGELLDIDDEDEDAAEH